MKRQWSALLVTALVSSPVLLFPQFQIYFSPHSQFPLGSHLLLAAAFFCAIWRAFFLAICAERRDRFLRFSGVTAVSFVVLFCLVYSNPITIPRLIGAPAIYLSFVLFALTLIFVVFFLHRYLGLALLAVIAGMILFRDIYHPFRTLPYERSGGDRYPFRDCPSREVACAFQKWLVERPDLDYYRDINRAYPVFLVSAEGGGIYAATHSFSVLEAISKSCPSFRQHVFSISSVSGGSFGAAAYAVDERFEDDRIQPVPCRFMRVSDLEAGFSNDHFSPVIASFVYSNIAQFILPFVPDRFFPPASGEALESSFEHALENSDLAVSAKKYWDPSANRPIVAFNSTDTSTGVLKIISPVGLAAQSDPFDIDGGMFSQVHQHVRLSTAAGISARFPFITATASSPINETLSLDCTPGLEAKENDENAERPSNRGSVVFDDLIVIPLDESESEAVVSPFANTPCPDELSVERAIYADGGYFDGSGVVTTLSIQDSLINSFSHGASEGCFVDESYCNFLTNEANVLTFSRSETFSTSKLSLLGCLVSKGFESCVGQIWRNEIIPVQFFHLVIFSKSDAEMQKKQTVLDPIRTLLAARSSRAEVARKELEFRYRRRCIHSGSFCNDPDRELGAFPIFHEILDVATLGLPLSWSLGSKQYESVKEKVYSSLSCEAGPSLDDDLYTGCLGNWVSGILAAYDD